MQRYVDLYNIQLFVKEYYVANEEALLKTKFVMEL